MYCSNCGAQIPDHSRFCPKCGAPQDVKDAGNLSKNAGTVKMRNRQEAVKESASKKRYGKIVPIIIVSAIAVIVLCVVVTNTGSSGSYEAAITNMLKVRSGDYADTSEAISLIAPKSISGDLGDLYDITFSSDYVQAVYGNPISYQDTPSAASLKEITSAEKLDKDSLDEYAEEIHRYGSLNFLGTGGYGADLIAYVLGISESNAQKALKDIDNIQDTLSSATVSDGYTVSFTYTDDDGEHDENADIICVDGSWVVAPDSYIDDINWTSLLYG